MSGWSMKNLVPAQARLISKQQMWNYDQNNRKYFFLVALDHQDKWTCQSWEMIKFVTRKNIFFRFRSAVCPGDWNLQARCRPSTRSPREMLVKTSRLPKLCEKKRLVALLRPILSVHPSSGCMSIPLDVSRGFCVFSRNTTISQNLGPGRSRSHKFSRSWALHSTKLTYWRLSQTILSQIGPLRPEIFSFFDVKITNFLYLEISRFAPTKVKYCSTRHGFA